MPHSLIVGMTNTGKTTLAIKIAQESKARGWPIIVLDPTFDPRWDFADYTTDNKNDFLYAYYNSRECRVFIDESVETASNSDKEIITTATRGRHYGHQNFYIGQRAKMVARNIRTQCYQVFAFRQTPEESKLLYQDFGHEILLECSKLPNGSYVHACGVDGTRGKIF
jgi:hypothetical protein